MNFTNKLVLVVVIILHSYLMNAQTKIIAHRGFSSAAPENTLVSFQKSIECGADYFELDVRKTKDNIVVVIHDSTVDRTSSNSTKGEISKLNYVDLSDLKVGYSSKFSNQYKTEKIPTLKEALVLAKGKIKVCIEIKVLGIEQDVIDIVNDLGVKDEVIIFSFYYPVLAKIRQLDQTIPILYLIGNANDTTIDYAKVIKANAIGVGYDTPISKEFLASAHKNGLEIWKWTVNEEKEMKELIAIGLDGLITDYPDKALKIKL